MTGVEPVAGVLPTRPRSAPAPARRRRVGLTGRVLGRPPADQPRADDPARLRAAGRAPATSTTCGWPPATAKGTYQALGIMFDEPFPFLDSDVYKWLEARRLGVRAGAGPGSPAAADEAIALVAARAAARRLPQHASSRWSSRRRAMPDLALGPRAVLHRPPRPGRRRVAPALGDDRLLAVARPRRRTLSTRSSARRAPAAIDGHPEIEMALVELYRVTGERRYLELARRLIDRRGQGRSAADGSVAAYWQDHAPVREAASSPATPSASSTSTAARSTSPPSSATRSSSTRSPALAGHGRDAHLPDRRRRQPPRDEAFGDPFELPPDRAYTETCAAIAERDARLAPAARHRRSGLRRRRSSARCTTACCRVVSLDGTRFFYVNPLQRRTTGWPAEQGTASARLVPLRLLPAEPDADARIVAAASGDDRRLRHPAAPVRAGEIAADVARRPGPPRVETDYPWTGRVTVRMSSRRRSAGPWRSRVPRAWCDVSATVADGATERVADGRGRAAGRRDAPWRAGDTVDLDLDMPPRLTVPDPRVDAIRGCVALERGPLVYCVETADLPAGVELEDVRLARVAGPRSPWPRARTSATRIIGLRSSAIAAEASAIDARAPSLLRLGQPRGRRLCGYGSPRPDGGRDSMTTSRAGRRRGQRRARTTRPRRRFRSATSAASTATPACWSSSRAACPMPG